MDPYLIWGEEGDTRKATKAAMNIMFNTTNRHAAVGAIEAAGYKAPKQCSNWLEALRAIEAHHEPIAHYFYANKGLEIQALDSRIVEMIMLEMIKQKTVALPIHDSFVCKAGD